MMRFTVNKTELFPHIRKFNNINRVCYNFIPNIRGTYHTYIRKKTNINNNASITVGNNKHYYLYCKYLRYLTIFTVYIHVTAHWKYYRLYRYKLEDNIFFVK